MGCIKFHIYKENKATKITHVFRMIKWKRLVKGSRLLEKNVQNFISYIKSLTVYHIIELGLHN